MRGLLILSFFLMGCGLNMESQYQSIRPQLVARDFNAADATLDATKESFYSEKNRLLFYMDKSVVLQLAGRYKESNEFLEKAKQTSADLWTESFSEHVGALIGNDNALAYQGEDFEHVLIHLLASLNYLAMDQWDDAQVEARQVTERLDQINRKHEGEERSVYADDAFSRWLAGRMRAIAGTQEALNDAWIDYRRALEVYDGAYRQFYGTRIPTLVLQDAILALRKLGASFADQLQEVTERYGDGGLPKESISETYGEVMLIHQNGEAPFKVDDYWFENTPHGPLRIAFPRFIKKFPNIAGSRIVRVADKSVMVSELLEDISSIAVRNLQDHMGRIKAKAIARAVTKHVAGAIAQEVGKNLKNTAGTVTQLAGLAWNIGNAVAEEADKRSWLTLPSEVRVARLFLPAGVHALELEFYTETGDVLVRLPVSVEVTPGKTSFFLYRTFL